MDETRRKRFKRLANLRVNRILKDLQLLGNLSNRSHYDYTEEEVKRIFRAIDEQLKGSKIRFKKRRMNFKI